MPTWKNAPPEPARRACHGLLQTCAAPDAQENSARQHHQGCTKHALQTGAGPLRRRGPHRCRDVGAITQPSCSRHACSAPILRCKRAQYETRHLPCSLASPPAAGHHCTHVPFGSRRPESAECPLAWLPRDTAGTPSLTIAPPGNAGWPRANESNRHCTGCVLSPRFSLSAQGRFSTGNQPC